MHRQARECQHVFSSGLILYAPINLVYAAFSAVMVYLTAYRNATLCILHIVITLTFSFTVLARLEAISELIPGFLHIVVGLMAFYHAIASLTQAFTGSQLVPLGPAFLHHGKPAFNRRATDGKDRLVQPG